MHGCQRRCSVHSSHAAATAAAIQLAGTRRASWHAPSRYAPHPAPQRPRTCVPHTRTRVLPLSQGGGATNPDPDPNPDPNPNPNPHPHPHPHPHLAGWRSCWPRTIRAARRRRRMSGRRRSSSTGGRGWASSTRSPSSCAAKTARCRRDACLPCMRPNTCPTRALTRALHAHRTCTACTLQGGTRCAGRLQVARAQAVEGARQRHHRRGQRGQGQRQVS